MTGPVGPVRHGDHMNPDDIVTEVARWPDTCESGVYRGNDYVECGKPAIGIRVVEDDDESAAAGAYGWPVCVAHARVGRMVPLRDLLGWCGQLSPRPENARHPHMDPATIVAEYVHAQGITVHTRFPGELAPTGIDEDAS